MSNFSTSEINTEVNEEISTDEHILMHLDIDYFFAQVEILKQPELREKPVIVGHERARETRRGVVLTCNYLAREYGIHSGQPMAKALDLCPDAVIVKSSYDDYKAISNTIMTYLEELNAPMRKAGIDEAYVDITPHVENYSDAKDFAISVKHDIFKMTNLTVSIGIGPTLKIAKIGSDFNKPDGISVFSPDDLDSLFKDLPLKKIPGIGQKTSQWLEKKGFTTADQLRKLNKADLLNILGKNGLYYYKILHARSTNKIIERGDRKSVSHSRTFIAKPGEIEKCRQMMDKLFDRSYKTLVKEKFLTKTVNVRVRFNGFDTITRAKSTNIATKDRDKLYKITEELITSHLTDRRGIRLLGVGFSNLKKIDEKQSTLDDYFADIEIPQGENKYSLSNWEVLISLLNRSDENKETTKKPTTYANLSDFF